MKTSQLICFCGVAAILLLTTTAAKGQALIMLIAGDKIASENFVGGIVGGISMSKMSHPDTATFYVSWSFGALLQWRLNDDWVLSPEVTFKMPAGARGMSGLWVEDPQFDTALANREEWTALSYVSIPILLKYTVSNFCIVAGPQIGYLVAATDNVSGTGQGGGAVTIEKSAFSRLNRWDVGVAVGMEWLLDPSIGLQSLRFGARYYRGFLDATANDDFTSTNSSFLFTVGVPIGVAAED